MLTTALSALLAVATLFGASVGHPLTGREFSTSNPRDGEEPCKQLRDAVATWLQNNPVVHRNITEVEMGLIPAVPPVPVKPSLAFGCLKSIPLDKDSALAHLDFLRPHWEWQSTIDYNKKPPRGYLSEGVDIIRGIKEIAAKLKTTPPSYSNEFQFLFDLQLLQNRVRDSHFGSWPLLLDFFIAELGKKFVSISQDGRTAPQIFLHDDLRHNQDGYKPSPVVTIDGAPALGVLQDMAMTSWGTHDPDARFNTLFPSVSKTANIFYPGGLFLRDGLSDRTTVVLQNGSTIAFDNIAFVTANLTTIASGADLYRELGLVSGKAPAPLSAATYKLADNRYAANYAQGGFPTPMGNTLGGDMAWFLPEGPALKNIAILVLNNFQYTPDILDFSNPESGRELWKLLGDFVSKAKAAGCAKLVIDMQGNGGGQLPRLAATYYTLFPEAAAGIFPMQSQARAHPQLSWLQNAPRTGSSKYPLAWSFGMYRQLNGTPFPDTHTWLGPITTPFGNLTVPASTDPEIFVDRVNSPADFPPKVPTSPPFAPENITIVTDGECNSACALLVEVLTHKHKIRTVALGGRPLYKAMQAVGRTKGAPVANFGGFPAIDRATAPPGVEVVPTTGPALRLRTTLSDERRGRYGGGVRFNMANQTPLGEAADALPLQFRYEAAHCKVFWTWEMARDIKKVWERVADVAWGEGRCVEGSTTGEGGKMGNTTRGYEEGVEDEGSFGPGPGAL